MSRINIHRNTFLEKEELTRMITFLSENNSVNAILASSGAYGIIAPQGTRGSEMKVTVSPDGNSLNINRGYIVAPDNKSYYLSGVSKLAVPEDKKFYWVKATAFEHNYEDGTVQVDAAGKVSGTVNFAGVVRGQGSGVPTCVRFVRTDGGTLKNDKVYQVVDIVDANNVVLSGGYAFTAETGLRVVVLGSIPMGRRFTYEQLEGLYVFTGVNITLEEEVVLNTAPAELVDGEYWLARVQNNDGQVVVEDKRSAFWLFGDGVLPPYQQFTVLEEDYEPYNE